MLKSLNVVQKESLLKIFNISLGKAASSFSDIIGREISLGIPDLEVLDFLQFKKKYIFELNGSVSCILESFNTDHGSGRIFLFFPENEGTEVVKLMLNEAEIGIDFTSYEQEALVEIGNIFLNHCISMIADFARDEFICQIPVYKRGNFIEIIQNGEGAGYNGIFMVLRINFQIRKTNICGHVFFISDITLINNLINSALNKI